MSDTTGPAFPVQTVIAPNGKIVGCADKGMTLRDYFAAKAMQGLTTSGALEDGHVSAADIARESYAMADAMFTERERGKA